MRDDLRYPRKNSLSPAAGSETRNQASQEKAAGLTVRQPRSVSGRARRTLVRTAVAGAIVAMGIVGVGGVGAAGEASAKPMERERVKYCTKVNGDFIFTLNAWQKALARYGEDNVLTIQAASNLERAEKRMHDTGC